jgi:integrase
MEKDINMSRVKLTAGRVRDFSCEPGKAQSFLWDTEAPGLAVRATAGGAKAYIFQGKLADKTIRVTIGDVRTWAIEAGDTDRQGAREEARRLQALIDQKIDPRQAKAEQIAEAEAKRAARKRSERRRDITVSEAWGAYTEARRPKWSARHHADHINLAHAGGNVVEGRNRFSEPGALASLMALRLSDINDERVKAWLRDEAARRPTQAALAFRLLRAFLNWCDDTPDYRGIAGADACRTRIAKDALPKKAAKSDCLQREQLPGWFAAVRAIPNPVISAYLQTLLLIGSRREELAWLQWEDVDFRWQSIAIHDKVEGERVIPLTPFVASLLATLPRRNKWVFSSAAAESGRLREPSIQHRRVCAIAGIEGMTLHGLRRSFGTLAEWVECPAGVVAQVMGHKPSATAEKHYRVRPLDLLRQWHTKIEAWILEQAGIEFVPEKAGLQLVAGYSKKAII